MAHGLSIRAVACLPLFCLSLLLAASDSHGASRGAALADQKLMNTMGARMVGADTRGGARPFGKIYRVTTLADSGPGSLRHAVSRHGPRIVVFDVGGVIKLNTDLGIFNPWITIAGQTAPSPGITLIGGTLRIRTSEVIIQHIAVRPGPADDPAINRKRDAISLAPCNRCKIPPSNILLDQLSLSWAVDEVVGMFGGTLRGITVRNSIVAEGLRKAGHPKGAHSAGLLIGGGALGVEVVGNLFANNGFRNPAVNAGASVVIANNYIYNPHNAAIHVNSGPDSALRTRVSVIGNVLDPGEDTRSNVATVALSKRLPERTPDAVIFSRQNRTSMKSGLIVGKHALFRLRGVPPLLPSNWELQLADLVPKSVLQFAGSRPSDRDVVDQRIIEGVKTRTGRIIDEAPELAKLREMPSTEKANSVPKWPFSISGIPGMLRIEAWLCIKHLDVGGPVNKQCNLSRVSLEDALTATGLLPR